MNYLSYLILIVAGIAAAMQAQIMGQVEKKLGTFENAFLVYVIGVIPVLIYYFFFNRFSLMKYKVLDWPQFSGGLLGIVIVTCIGVGVSRVGVLTALLLIFVFQTISAGVIDHFGLFGSEVKPIGIMKAIALLLIGCGATLLVKFGDS